MHIDCGGIICWDQYRIQNVFVPSQSLLAQLSSVCSFAFVL